MPPSVLGELVALELAAESAVAEDKEGVVATELEAARSAMELARVVDGRVISVGRLDSDVSDLLGITDSTLDEEGTVDLVLTLRSSTELELALTATFDAGVVTAAAVVFGATTTGAAVVVTGSSTPTVL